MAAPDFPTLPFMRELDEQQTALLQVIWESVVPGWQGAIGSWPVWSNVEHEMYRQFHESDRSAIDILESLGTIASPSAGSNGYGLVWLSELGPMPLAHHTVGLTIAGMAQLARVRPAVDQVANGLVAVLAMLANWEYRLVAKPSEVAAAEVELSDFTVWLRSRSLEKIFEVPDDVTAQTLYKEIGYPVSLSKRDDQWYASLYGNRMLGYGQLGGWRDYLTFIAKKYAPVSTASTNRTDGQMEDATVQPIKIFLVHGHDDGSREMVARKLEKLTGLEVDILAEKPNGGLTIMEKFEKYGSGASVAVVLFTPDDVGGMKGSTADTLARARQNVIFELGYFIGKLGRARVIAMVKGAVEIPSDFLGVLYLELDKDNWPAKLAAELSTIEGVEISAKALLE